MNLVEFTTTDNLTVYINPDTVTLLIDSDTTATQISFTASTVTAVTVNAPIEHVAAMLTTADTKEPLL